MWMDLYVEIHPGDKKSWIIYCNDRERSGRFVQCRRL